MMNDKTFQHKFARDVNKAKRDLVELGNDGVARLSRIIEQPIDDAKKRMALAMRSFNKSVDHELRQYNTSVQKVASKVPGGLGKKATTYPWVTFTMSLAFGLFVGIILRLTRPPVC